MLRESLKFSMQYKMPPEDPSGSNCAAVEQHRLVLAIEQDFRALLDDIERYQAIAGQDQLPHVEAVRTAIKRGLVLTEGLRGTISFER